MVQMNAGGPARDRYTDRIAQGMPDQQESGHSGSNVWVKYHILGVILGIPRPPLEVQFQAK
jgi:hypothetical protein